MVIFRVHSGLGMSGGLPLIIVLQVSLKHESSVRISYLMTQILPVLSMDLLGVEIADGSPYQDHSSMEDPEYTIILQHDVYNDSGIVQHSDGYLSMLIRPRQ